MAMKKLSNGIPYERIVEGDKVMFKAEYKSFFVVDECLIENEAIVFKAFESMVNAMYKNYESR